MPVRSDTLPNAFRRRICIYLEGARIFLPKVSPRPSCLSLLIAEMTGSEAVPLLNQQTSLYQVTAAPRFSLWGIIILSCRSKRVEWQPQGCTGAALVRGNDKRHSQLIRN